MPKNNIPQFARVFVLIIFLGSILNPNSILAAEFPYHKNSTIDINAHIKALLQKRNQKNAKQPLIENNVPNKPFERYKKLNVSAALLNRSIDPENLVDKWAFDPAKNHLLTQSITKPFLTKRGIQEVLSVGVSDFSGSSANRFKNMEVTINKFDGYIIPKGAEFSFNQILGEVTKEAGFVYEKVIVSGKNQYGLGGGICQISTNIFRAALNAGLPITERRNHSQAIEKYAPQGLDATIYIGVQDLKFINDTPGDILIKFAIRDQKLFTIFYGTQDHRKVNLAKTKTWRGYDGRLTTHWQRVVKRRAIPKNEETFISHYYNPIEEIALQ